MEQQRQIHPIEFAAQSVYSIQKHLFQITSIVETLCMEIDKLTNSGNNNKITEFNAQK